MNNVSAIINNMNIFVRNDGRYEGRITINYKRASTHVGTGNTARNLIRRGVGIEVIRELMGHSNITITYNKYMLEIIVFWHFFFLNLMEK